MCVHTCVHVRVCISLYSWESSLINEAAGVGSHLRREERDGTGWAPWRTLAFNGQLEEGDLQRKQSRGHQRGREEASEAKRGSGQGWRTLQRDQARWKDWNPPRGMVAGRSRVRSRVASVRASAQRSEATLKGLRSPKDLSADRQLVQGACV